MAGEDRFEVVSSHGGMFKDTGALTILRDRETGVCYLMAVCGYGGGLTALLDSDGKPVVMKD